MLEQLRRLYPQAKSLLVYCNPFELLVGVVLSAQTTDVQVNNITPALFARFPDAASLAKAELTEVENLIRTVGFYRVKARNLVRLAQMLEGREIPDHMEELLQLPGVGRKSASVILSQVYGKPAVTVDRHFSRVVRRIGLTSSEHPEQIERDIMRQFSSSQWSEFSMLINHHGRFCCMARKPRCEECPLSGKCRYYAQRVSP